MINGEEWLGLYEEFSNAAVYCVFNRVLAGLVLDCICYWILCLAKKEVPPLERARSV